MSPSRRSLMMLLSALLLFCAAGFLQNRLLTLREEQQLQAVPPGDTTPLVAITTVAFGGFRGLVADALWIRAQELQQQGQFFELVQLATWITQLEPRIPEVWSFQAWNLAYNISVLFPDQEDRWRWVSSGIDLLREDGLQHNPRSASLHWDLGWLYQHKVGMSFDQSHRYYKWELAHAMNQILPGGRLATSDEEALRNSLQDHFRMDLATMQKLDERFGPIDWRAPAAHSLYWAESGLAFSASPFTIRMLQRMKLQSLIRMMIHGHLRGDIESGNYLSLSRPELIPLIREDYLRILEANNQNQAMRTGYINFLREAMVLLIHSEKLQDAWQLYMEVSQDEPQDFPPGRQAFEALIQQALQLSPADYSPEQANVRVIALLQQAKELTFISPARARGLQRIAEQTHRLYQNSRTDQEHLERTGLLPLPEIERILNDSASQNER